MTCPRSHRKPKPDPRFQSCSPAHALAFKSTLSSSTQSEKKYCRNLKFKLFATWRAAHVLALLSVYVERLQDITYIDSILNGNNHHNRFTVWQCLPVCYSNSNDIFFFLIKRFRSLVPLATFWIFLFLGRSNPYPQCFLSGKDHTWCYSMAQGRFCLGVILCLKAPFDFYAVSATWQQPMGRLGMLWEDTVSKHLLFLGKGSAPVLKEVPDSHGWRQWEALTLLCWLKTSRMCNKKKILITGLQWSNTFYLSAASEEGPKWIKLWEPAFRH